MPRLNVQNPLVLLLAALLVLSPAWARAEQAPPSTTMSGEGEVSAPPDLAHVSTGVVTRDATAQGALDANNAAMAQVVEEMKRAGIEPRDLQTSSFSVQPQYYHPPQGKDGRHEPPRIVGYQVSNTLLVRVRDLARLGAILDISVRLGANQLGGISFAVSEPAPYLETARKAAMADAIARASLYAEAAGVRLGRVLSISENGGGRPSPVFARMARAEDAAPVPIEAGEQAISARVSVTWELLQ